MWSLTFYGAILMPCRNRSLFILHRYCSTTEQMGPFLFNSSQIEFFSYWACFLWLWCWMGKKMRVLSLSSLFLPPTMLPVRESQVPGYITQHSWFWKLRLCWRIRLHIICALLSSEWLAVLNVKFVELLPHFTAFATWKRLFRSVFRKFLLCSTEFASSQVCV